MAINKIDKELKKQTEELSEIRTEMREQGYPLWGKPYFPYNNFVFSLVIFCSKCRQEILGRKSQRKNSVCYDCRTKKQRERNKGYHLTSKKKRGKV